jgi:hypothetical protein
MAVLAGGIAAVGATVGVGSEPPHAANRTAVIKTVTSMNRVRYERFLYIFSPLILWIRAVGDRIRDPNGTNYHLKSYHSRLDWQITAVSPEYSIAPDDPFCCPTQHVLNTYAVQNGELVEVSLTEIQG